MAIHTTSTSMIFTSIDNPTISNHTRTGNWMPADHKTHKEWLGGIIRKVDEKQTVLHPVLEEFKHLIETNTRVYMLLTSMFKEVPRQKRYGHDPTGNPEIRDHHHFLQVLNHL